MYGSGHCVLHDPVGVGGVVECEEDCVDNEQETPEYRKTEDYRCPLEPHLREQTYTKTDIFTKTLLYQHNQQLRQLCQVWVKSGSDRPQMG